MSRHTKAEGYTLVELLIALTIAGLIGGAIVGVYRVSQDTYVRASSLEAAQTGARAGLDRMANELRLIGSYWVGASGAGNAITAASQTSITFQADVDADTLNAAGREITLTAAAASGSNSISVNRTTGTIGNNAFTAGEWVLVADGATREVKQIGPGYTTGLSIPLTAPLTSSFLGPPQPATVRSVETITYDLNGTSLRRNGSAIVDNVTNLTFTYFGTDGVTQTANAALIREIRIDLTVQSPDGSARRMTTRVKPRSLP
jgi:prepilin-type N-terminal cleavage/methylation domain-containing protein